MSVLIVFLSVKKVLVSRRRSQPADACRRRARFALLFLRKTLVRCGFPVAAQGSICWLSHVRQEAERGGLLTENEVVFTLPLSIYDDVDGLACGQVNRFVGIWVFATYAGVASLRLAAKLIQVVGHEVKLL